MISYKYKCVFIAVPKTGTRAISRFLIDTEAKNGDSKLYGGWRSHMRLGGIIGRFPETEDWYKFSVVRNPWDRLVSEYSYLMRVRPGLREQKLTFREFLLECKGHGKLYKHHIKPHVFFYNHSSPVDRFIRFENLQDGFDLVCDDLAIERFELPMCNTTTHEHYTQYYEDKKMIETAANWYAEDIERFGYEFGQ